jgi:hypothetical protein
MIWMMKVFTELVIYMFVGRDKRLTMDISVQG